MNHHRRTSIHILLITGSFYRSWRPSSPARPSFIAGLHLRRFLSPGHKEAEHGAVEGPAGRKTLILVITFSLSRGSEWQAHSGAVRGTYSEPEEGLSRKLIWLESCSVVICGLISMSLFLSLFFVPMSFFLYMSPPFFSLSVPSFTLNTMLS